MGWDAVGYGGDPIPDDPGVVHEHVQHLRAVAATIKRGVELLPSDDRIDGLEWDSDAAVGFRQVVKKLPRDLDALRVRYEKVATALEGFERGLRHAKAKAHEGLVDAERAVEAAAQAQAGVASMKAFTQQAAQAAAVVDQGAPPGTPPAVPEPWTGPDHSTQLVTANEALKRAKGQVDEAVREFHHAARVAASAVHHAADDSLKNDTGFMGAVKRTAKWMVENLPLKEIADLLSKVALVAGVLALVPGLQWLLPVAVAASIGAALADGALIVNKVAEGEKLAWQDRVTIGLAVVSVATAGVGGAARLARGAAGRAGTRAATAHGMARARSAARASADATAAAKAARAQRLDSGWLKWPNRLLGRTGRAERAAERAQEAARAAAARETEAQAAAAAARARAEGREQLADDLARARSGARYAEVAADTADVGVDLHDQKLLALAGVSPGGAVVVSTAMDVGGTVDFYQHKRDVSRAAAAGCQIPAQPIR